MSAAPTLSGDGILLRPIARADAPALFLAMGDAAVQRFRRQSAHADVGETERYIDDTLARSRAAWAITEDGGEALGRLALRVPEPGVGEFGIVIRASAQRRGFGRKALALAEDYAFTDLGLARLTANIDAENAASIALFTRAGYVQTDYLRAHRTTELGVRDSVILAKVRPGG